jgi:hypothetical protein
LKACKALPIKAFVDLPTKSAKLNIVINQGLAFAIGFVATLLGQRTSLDLDRDFCA